MSESATPRSNEGVVTAGTGRLLAWIGVIAGVAIALFALTFDLGGASKGVGRLQGLGALAGALLSLTAGALLTAPGRPWLRRLVAAAEASRVEALGLAGIALQVGVATWLMFAFRIESPAFYQRVMPLVAGGFLVNHVLPAQLRLRFFAVLSVVGLAVVFGPVQALWILGLGGALIALCHLPAPFATRVALLVASGVALAAVRVGVLPSPWSGAIWPILGSMFMFRLAAYVYDLRHLKVSGGSAWPVAYLFCLPNVAFPLFPVIDYATFRRTYYDKPAFEIYQQGLAWIFRGLVHLILYRLVYGFFTLSPAEVDSGAALVRYVLANFGLYLRVSGQFHLIIGLLHLFGFRLPETHRFFYLASSFTDFWRRINIYWKDFMQKLVFNPAYFRLRKRWGDTSALVLATLAVFVSTWTLHSYQWFWLLGTWLWSATDTLFWGILAAILAVSVVLEARKGRVRTLRVPPALTLRSGISLGANTAVTFATIALLWTLWTAPSLREFVALMGTFSFARAQDVLLLVAVLASVGVAAVIVRTMQAPVSARRPLFAVAGQATALGALYVAGLPGVGTAFTPKTREVLRDLRVVELNRQDQEQLQRGYYEKIVGINRFNSELWRVYGGEPQGAKHAMLEELGVLRDSRDGRRQELAPFAGTYFLGQPFRTNQWGMRDKEYDKARAPGVHRTVVLGSSFVMGWGVGDGETFEAVMEQRLNARPLRHGASRYDVLNMAVNAYALFHYRFMLENGSVFSFDPDVVMVIGHENDLIWNTDYLLTELKEGRRPEPAIAAMLDLAGITGTMERREAQRRLTPYRMQLARLLLKEIADLCRARGIRPVYAYVPTPSHTAVIADAPLMIELARDAGFVVFDLRDVYAGVDERSLLVGPNDVHPNKRGHQLIAARLLQEYELHPELLRSRDGVVARGKLP
jgi:D-alanyl-lipoteichoic acid acyltransferase DltB (MBOAT superfamily)